MAARAERLQKRFGKLMRIKAERWDLFERLAMDWQPIATAPFDREVKLAVIDANGVHAIAFPCRRVLHGWVSANTHSPVDVRPTHWCEWGDFAKQGSSPKRRGWGKIMRRVWTKIRRSPRGHQMREAAFVS